MKGRKHSFKKGSYIYIEGDEDVESIYIVEKGEVQLVPANKNVPPFRNVLREGDIFGFITALSNRPRMESALTQKDTTVGILNREQFLLLLQNHPTLAFKIINYFADHLRSYNDMIFPGDFKEDSLPVETRLFNMGMYYYNAGTYEMAYYIFIKLMQLYPRNAMAAEIRECIGNIERSGFRAISEAVKEGMYYVYADKQVIFCEDEPGEELFFIKQGKVKIVKYNQGTEIMLSVLQEGDIFGELAIVSDKERNATAIAFGRTVLMPVNRNSLARLISRSPQILKKIFTSISQRVWFTYIRLEARTYKQPLTRIYAFLENKMIEENISLRSADEFTFNFGIDELLRMTELSPEKNSGSIEELLKDPNLHFNFGKISIMSIKSLSARSKYYRSRDHIAVLEKEGEQKEESKPLLKPKIEEADDEIAVKTSESKSIIEEMKDLEDIDIQD